MEPLEHVKTYPDWAGREVIDILSHHVNPALWLGHDSLSCRLVCRSWSAAFPAHTINVNPETFMSDVKRDLATRLASRVSEITLSDANAAGLAWIQSILAENRRLKSLEFDFKELTVTEAETLSKILLSRNLQSLRWLTLRSDETASDTVVQIISDALAETQAPIRHLDLFFFRINASSAAILLPALLRGPKTLRKLIICRSKYDQSLAAPISDFLLKNQNVTRLRARGIVELFEDSVEGCTTLFDALAANTTLTSLDMQVEGTNHQFYRVFSILRTNTTLCKLRIHGTDMKGADLSFIADCLCDNKHLEDLSLELYESSPTTSESMGRVLAQNKSLKRLGLKFADGDTTEMSDFFKGLKMNSTLKKLNISSPPPNFVRQLSECILDSQSVVNLKDLEIGYSTLDFEAAAKLSAAVLSMPDLERFYLFVVDCGPETVDPFVRMIESSKSLHILGFFCTKHGSPGLIRICEAIKKSKILYEVALGGETHSEDAILAVCDMVANTASLEYVDFSGTSIPMHLKPQCVDAVMKNERMYRFEVCFTDEKGEEAAEDLKYELVKQSFKSSSSSASS